ncbi:MAG: hydrogenase 4 subunit F [Chloroflexi bacterium]|nr:hydrogenase 4 subunit F [Chloroflexota bacterium]
MVLTWLLFVPLILSLMAFAARWLGGLSRFLVLAFHLGSVTLTLILSLFTAEAVLEEGHFFGLGNWLYVDALGVIFLLIIGVVGFLVGIYSIGYTRHDLQTGEIDTHKLSTYYGLFNLFLFTMLLVVTANNIIMMWVAVEATTLGSAFLVGIYGHRASLEAAWKYIMICTVGVAFGLYGTVLVYSDAFNVMQVPGNAVLWTEIIKNTELLDPTLIKMAFVFVLVGFGTKAGLFPMHSWLPDAHSEAPSPISALLSGVLLNCALLVIFRFSTISNLVLGPSFAQTLFLIFGTISVAVAAFFIYVQRDIKRLLAYSSVENVGLIVMAFGIGGSAGIFAGLLQAINHSLVKSLMFCTSGNILIKYRSRSLDQVRGMLQVIPYSSALLMVGALALVGTPPLNIFLSKFFIITSGFGAGHFWLMALCLLFLVVIFAAFFRVIASTLLGERPDSITRGEANWLTLLPGAALAILIVALGLYIPSELMSLLNGASDLALYGNTGQQVTMSMKDYLSPLAQFLR